PSNLPSFPTRRSSDLRQVGHRWVVRMRGAQQMMMMENQGAASASASADGKILAAIDQRPADEGEATQTAVVVIDPTSRRELHRLDRKSTRLNSSHVKI